MRARIVVPRRGLALAATAGLVVLSLPSPALAAENDDAGSGVRVVNTETVRVYLAPDGSIDSQRVYEQLAMTGKGTVDLANPLSTDGLRNLDGFGGLSVRDGEQIVHTDVDGVLRTRSVSTYTRKLPLDVGVDYRLDGTKVEPGDVVGRSGRLQVTFRVANVTAQPQRLEFDDGHGGTLTRTVDVPVPMVGSVSTTTPPSFTNVRSEQANIAGDGQGGTKLSFTMTLFPPIGATTAQFGYSADIEDGVVPRVEISALPVNPLESPTFKTAADSYRGGAETGVQLVAGAVQIDANLLKLRDGAADLLAGLIKLNDGAAQLDEGLSGSAAPGARRLAGGAGELKTGLAELEDGSLKLRNGVGSLARGTRDLDRGAGTLHNGAKKLSTGAGAAAAGGKKLTAGLKQLSGGLGQLDQQLPAASEGVKKLKQGIDQLSAGLGSPGDPDTLIGGLVLLGGGLDQLRGDGSAATPGLIGAKGGVDQVKAGLDDALRTGGDLDQLRAGVQGLKAMCDPAVPACGPTADAVLDGITGARTKLGTASAGLGVVSSGLATAIGAVDSQLRPGTGKLTAGAQDAKAGVARIGAGLDELAAGVTAAVTGIDRLHAGSVDALSGSTDLSAGLGELSAGADRLSKGSGALATGAGKLDDGAGQVRSGAGRLASGLGDARGGSSRLADGAGELASGLDDAAEGSGRLAEGLHQAADAAPRLPEGAERLSEEGTSKLVEAGEDTTQTYGEMVAVLQAGAERARTTAMAYGAPTDAIGLTAYSYTIKGAAGEGGRNTARLVGGLAMLAVGGGVLALRRRRAA